MTLEELANIEEIIAPYRNGKPCDECGLEIPDAAPDGVTMCLNQGTPSESLILFCVCGRCREDGNFEHIKAYAACAPHNCKRFISPAAVPYLQSMIDQPKKEMVN